jgi:hypothetical protein
MLQGYKTYIMAAAVAGISVAHYMGYLDDSATAVLLGLFGSGGAAALAAKINRTQQ